MVILIINQPRIPAGQIINEEKEKKCSNIRNF